MEESVGSVSKIAAPENIEERLFHIGAKIPRLVAHRDRDVERHERRTGDRDVVTRHPVLFQLFENAESEGLIHGATAGTIDCDECRIPTSRPAECGGGL